MRAWLTPDEIPATTVCRYLRIPNDWRWEAAFRGALLLLTEAENWEQFGALTPEETADAWGEVLWSYVTGGTGCEGTGGMGVVGSIIAYAGSEAPEGWLLCDGAFYAPAEYPELFTVIGYTYGQSGDDFAVPDLRGRVLVGAGAAPGLTPRERGSVGGEEAHVLTVDEMPSHRHAITQATGDTGQYFAGRATASGTGYTGYTGGGEAHNTMPPYVVAVWIIRAV